MASQVAHATGNFTAVGSWLVTDATSEKTNGTTATNVTTSNLDSAAFTPGAITVRGIALQLNRRAGTTGTFTVTLRNSTGGIDAASVTINCSDLPAETASSTNADGATDGSWQFFDFGSNILLLAATNYVVRCVSSTTIQVVLLAGASNDWNRLLVTSSAPGSLAAGDRFFMSQSYLSAGSATTRTITGDNNNTTAWGQIVNANGCTFTVSVAAATQLRQTGVYQAWGGSTTNWGTSGAPCVIGQATIWEMNTSSDGQFGWQWFWNAAFSAYGASKTACIVKLAADLAAAGTSATIDTNVGTTWRNGDVLVFAGTTRTAADTETKALGANSSGTSLPTIAALTNAHSGTSPTAGHVANLTRDLVFRTVGGSTTSNGTYMWWSTNYTGTTTMYWGEYAQFGMNLALKRGLEVDAIAGTFDIQFNSIHDFTEAGAQAMFFASNAGVNYTFSNNIIHNYRSAFTNTATSATGWTVNANMASATSSGGPGFVMNDVGGTFTNNIAVGGTTTSGMSLAEAAVIGTCSGNITYNNAVTGLLVSAYMSGTILNHTSWRNNTFGLTITGVNSFSGALGGLVFDTYTCFGNTTAGSTFGGTGGEPITFINCVYNAGVTLTQPVGHSVAANLNQQNATFRNCSFGVTTAHATGDINFIATAGGQIYTENCLLSSATPVSNPGSMSTISFVQHSRLQQVSGNWLKNTRFGTAQVDTVVFDTGTQSVKMTPTSAATKLQSDPIYGGGVNSGQTQTFSIRVRKGTSYNGNQIRLFVRANAAMGVNADTLLATGSASIGTWETLSGTTVAAIQNGKFDYYIDCDGTAGTINYQNWSAIVT